LYLLAFRSSLAHARVDGNIGVKKHKGIFIKALNLNFGMPESALPHGFFIA